MTLDYDRNLSSLKHRLGETKYLVSVAPLSYGDSIWRRFHSSSIIILCKMMELS
jgi:hypothetical protein